MTEREWLTSSDPAALLGYLTADRGPVPAVSLSDTGRGLLLVSDRKLLLFGLACWRLSGIADAAGHYAHIDRHEVAFPGALGDAAVSLAMAWAQPWDSGGRVSQPAKADLLRDIFNPFVVIERLHRPKNAAVDKCWSRSRTARPGDRLLTLDDAWLTPAVVALASAAYEERAGADCWKCESERVALHPKSQFRCRECGGTGKIGDGRLDPARLAVLADALIEAGCHEDALLAHLRSSGPHFRGAWGLDVLLGRA